jgi:hypothetical protein
MSAVPIIKLISFELYQIARNIGKGNTNFFVASSFM